MIVEATPQRTPGFTRLGRRLRARRDGRAHLARFQAHYSSVAVLPRSADFLAAANAQEGKPYNAAIGCRCLDSCPEQDCSGLVSGAINAVAMPLGYPEVCTSSFGFAQMCRAAGRLISEEQAIWTPGAVGIENPFGSSNGALGTNGHIVIMEGDGKTTIEEMGTRSGCCHGPATGRGFGAWALLPQLDYTPPTPVQREREMLVQTHHYNADGSVNRPTNPPAGQISVVAIAADGSCLQALWDASIVNDQPIVGTEVRHWTPGGVPLPKGVTIVGLADVVIGAHPGGYVLRSDGNTDPFHLS